MQTRSEVVLCITHSYTLRLQYEIFLFSPDACIAKINVIIKNNVNTSRCDDDKKLLL